MDLGLDQLQKNLEKFVRLPKSWRLGALGAFSVGVVGLYLWLFFAPASEHLAALRTQELELQRKLAEVRSVANNLKTFQEEVERLEKDLAIALRQLPNSKELPVLLTDISSLGKNAGLEFKSFRPKSEVPREFYAEVPIEIEFTGGFHQVAAFFDGMARLPRIVNVSDLEMTIAKESTQGTRLLVKGNATTFRFLDGPSSAAPAANATKGGNAPAKRPAAGGGEA